ncbi:hypothetical protein [Streptomyces sp. NPDC093225]|uniref:hypothetical protein n=1 Tax=Streptomyces sp. NPDC093225 TaxID=3366034 RepID=UPI0037F44460
MTRAVPVLIAAALVGALAGCGPGGGAAGGGTDGTARAGAAGGTSAAPARPGALPVLPSVDRGDAGAAETAMRELIRVAAAAAKGVPDDDRSPSVTVVDHGACRIYPVAGACPPTTPDQPVPIEIDAVQAWRTYTEREADGRDGNAAWQDEVLAAYVNYLMLRESQRTAPALLTSNDDADVPKLKKLQHCKQGNVVGPLRPVMSAALWHYFAALEADPDFRAGAEGRC